MPKPQNALKTTPNPPHLNNVLHTYNSTSVTLQNRIQFVVFNSVSRAPVSQVRAIAFIAENRLTNKQGNTTLVVARKQTEKMTEGNSTNVDDGAVKRDFENVGPMGNGTDSSNKKIKTENEENQDGGGDNDGNGNGTPSNDANEGSIGEGGQQLNWKEELAFVAPGTEGVTSINDNDVLSGKSV